MLSDYDRTHVREIVEDRSRSWFSANLFRFIKQSDALTRRQLRAMFSEEVNLVEKEFELLPTQDGEEIDPLFWRLVGGADMTNRAALMTCLPWFDYDSDTWR